jgi:hypothetical protein
MAITTTAVAASGGGGGLSIPVPFEGKNELVPHLYKHNGIRQGDILFDSGTKIFRPTISGRSLSYFDISSDYQLSNEQTLTVTFADLTTTNALTVPKYLKEISPNVYVLYSVYRINSSASSYQRSLYLSLVDLTGSVPVITHESNIELNVNTYNRKFSAHPDLMVLDSSHIAIVLHVDNSNFSYMGMFEKGVSAFTYKGAGNPISHNVHYNTDQIRGHYLFRVGTNTIRVLTEDYYSSISNYQLTYDNYTYDTSTGVFTGASGLTWKSSTSYDYSFVHIYDGTDYTLVFYNQKTSSNNYKDMYCSQFSKTDGSVVATFSLGNLYGATGTVAASGFGNWSRNATQQYLFPDSGDGNVRFNLVKPYYNSYIYGTSSNQMTTISHRSDADTATTGTMLSKDLAEFNGYGSGFWHPFVGIEGELLSLSGSTTMPLVALR